MVVRLLADARRRNEVRVTVSAPLAELTEIERRIEATFGINRVIVAPFADPDEDPVRVIAAAAGAFISSLMTSGMTVGVGWGARFTTPCRSYRARRWRISASFRFSAGSQRHGASTLLNRMAVCRAFQGEGFLIPAPAVVDSPETKHALLERCGLAAIFEMATKLDVALLSVGGISTLTTSYRTGYITEADRRSLIEAGAVGDVLYNFISEDGKPVQHEVNDRVISADLSLIRRCPERVLISGWKRKAHCDQGGHADLGADHACHRRTDGDQSAFVNGHGAFNRFTTLRQMGDLSAKT